jgi:hypothetical protein
MELAVEGARRDLSRWMLLVPSFSKTLRSVVTIEMLFDTTSSWCEHYSNEWVCEGRAGIFQAITMLKHTSCALSRSQHERCVCISSRLSVIWIFRLVCSDAVVHYTGL